ncbi:nitroreductase family protein [Aliidiomarina soli]|uniref:Nitroreductase-like protein n=1 Tax=Aliidiomarina soli TaxID=1928574 RepID=A0A432WD71_9GAMM|nr:nitroreductase family protein [Aliidiomarina soli]RUO30333.1 nitroreductase-like protein [Aliidiomarina soli]
MKQLLRKLVPSILVVALLRFKATLGYLLLKACSKSAFLTSFHYAFFNRRFYREHQSVLLGRLAYGDSLKGDVRTSYLLRRNIHRLEKGLIMKPRRPIFALNYIEETIDCYETAASNENVCLDELKWATDVLVSYFEVIESTSITAPLRFRFNKARKYEKPKEDILDNASDTENFIPYPSKDLPDLEVTTEELSKLYMRRRSTRWFESRPVPSDSLLRAIEMASTAPSACNRQPYSFKICTHPETAQKISKLAMGTSGFSDNIQSLIVVVGDLSAYPLERDRHCIYIDSSLASMQLMLALETMGLATCPINWPDIEEREQAMQDTLNLPKYLRPVMLIAVGYPDLEGGIPYSQKKPKEILAEFLN